MTTQRNPDKGLQKIFYVYQLRIQNQIHPFYIGKGCGKRAYEHFNARDLLKNSLKNNIIKKAWREGLQIYIEICEDGLDENAALSKEIEYISYYGRRCDGSGCLANLSRGGDGLSGYVTSATTRKKQSLARIGKSLSAETRQRMSDSKVGTHHSEETRSKISSSHLGRPKSPEARHKMRLAKLIPTEIYKARLAWSNPLMEFLSYSTRGCRVNLRCRFCGGLVDGQRSEMLLGKLPRDHYECASKVFDVAGGSQIYSKRYTPGNMVSRIEAHEPRDVAFTYQLVSGRGVVFRTTSGTEILRVRLPDHYIRARIRGERLLENRRI